MTQVLLTSAGIVVGVPIMFGAAYLGSRSVHTVPVLPVASTFRAFGAARVAVKTRIGVASHAARRAAAVAGYKARHRGVGRSTRRSTRRASRAREVAVGAHCRSLWRDLAERWTQLSALISGGAR